MLPSHAALTQFEIKGIQCRHVLRVCQLKMINVLPNRNIYVLDYWRKNLKMRYILIKSSYDELRGSADALRYEVVVLTLDSKSK